MDDYPCSLDVPEEFMAQACTLVCPFDQAGDVGHDESAIVAEFNDAEDGFEGGERVIGYFWPCRRAS